MPRRKRSRKHKKQHHTNVKQVSSIKAVEDVISSTEDHELRACADKEASLNTSHKIANVLEVISQNQRQITPSPDISNSTKSLRSRYGSFKENCIQKRHENSLNLSGLQYLFNHSNGYHSTSLVEIRSKNVKLRSNSSIPKLHSPGLEHVRLKTQAGTQTPKQTCSNFITETPRISHEDFFEFDCEMEPLRPTLLEFYTTPLQRLEPNSFTPIFDVRDSAVCIQDLNNLHREPSHRAVHNCSRVIKSDSLTKLKNFNGVILSTSQEINYDNCEQVEDNEIQFSVNEQNKSDVSNTEISFFTPHLYNTNGASTPIEKKEKLVTSPENLNQIKVLEKFQSFSSQVDRTPQNHICIQTTDSTRTPPILKCKEKAVTSAKRRSCRTPLPTQKLHSKSWQCLKTSPVHRLSLEQINDVKTVTTIETCARVVSKIKSYQGAYTYNLPEKIIDIVSWLGITIKKVK